MTYIIAEIGSNWHTKEHCFESIIEARKAGADAVKFQMYSTEELYGPINDAVVGELPREWIPSLEACCANTGIDFLCTAFSIEGLFYLDNFVQQHKIASAECLWPDFREAAIETGKDLIISTGGCSLEEIDDLKRHLPRSFCTLMYCAGAYPARYIDLNMICALKCGRDSESEHMWCVGYSDHSNTVVGVCDLAAKYYGASVIEKHVTAFPDLQTPDRPHSITMPELAYLIAVIKGKAIEHPTPEEATMVNTWRRTAERGWKRG